MMEYTVYEKQAVHSIREMKVEANSPEEAVKKALDLENKGEAEFSNYQYSDEGLFCWSCGSEKYDVQSSDGDLLLEDANSKGEEQ